ncbi:NADPH:quinone reductase-like Zn-dependent oxidoreductase [Pseudorhizobium tarimense]|uniref:NADPH:quinone reductase-like Zn-dependent oxidoreductase n=1 Tax=Pseudorhizobium tarimense TaxID=1079109 RepID=A0ABV2H9T6_9HYPH|nr:zinc-binding alcohol dehydrogenase [Pseudorhizobium tarimense]MCJ8520080.1 zinc-binding alcohol dehydrogenase [Pseudorhizobium tarimense]
MTVEQPAPVKSSREGARSLWIERAGQAAIRTETLIPLQPSQVTVEALFSGISRGTESLVFHGRVPETEFERMRGPHQEGEMSFPVKYGYAMVGTVLDGAGDLAGRRIFCLHPHQDRFRIGRQEVHVLPDALPPERAVLAANMETALNIVWDAGVLPGDRVVVFGAGIVGLLTAYIVSRIGGAEITLCDISPDRRDIARALGLPFCEPSDVPDDCDVLINASASPAALANALAHAGFEARIIEASWYGETMVEIQLGRAFHSKRLSIVSSQVGAIAPQRRGRWTFGRRLAKALEFLRDERLDTLISGETPFAAIAAAYGQILESPETLCHRIRY